ncbi:sigma 54-interacting transcriptional regulator [Niallia sp. XMNu-256]|uniref:sigma-54 interaction domain-containing protein n=1 Tax=Niallia sp. XMNu-256 TaxID=3082444 RepID=UPI0030CFD016
MIEDRAIFSKVMEALLNKLSVGVLITKDHNKIFSNEILSKQLIEMELEWQYFINRMENLEESVPTLLSFNNQEVLVRKESVSIIDGVYQVYLITSSETDQLQLGRQQELPFKDIIDYAYDGIVVIDKEGVIQMLSRPYAEFLGIDQESSIGKHVTEIIENSRMHIVAQTGKEEIAQLQRINGNYMIATRVPIIKDGKVIGAVGKVLFKNLDQLNSLTKRFQSLEKDLGRYKGEFKERNKATYTFESLIGKSPAFIEAKEQARKAAKSDSNVLILGESGTGKELFAHSIHNDSKRSMGVFIKVNCAAIPAELLESELFGYEEGSFTGAKKGGKIGKFEAADGGTIFLDEIGELPLHMQVKLLRVLQEKEIERVGSTRSVPIDVRIMAATNRNLEEMVEKGEFRLDIYYRLKVMTIHVPNLSERPEDIKLLVHHFLRKFQRLMSKSVEDISDHTLRSLSSYSWPGNIRELENTIERALNMVDEGEVITSDHLPEEISGYKRPTTKLTLAEIMEETERNTIIHYLEMVNGNKTETAKVLGISRTTLYEKMNKYGL